MRRRFSVATIAFLLALSLAGCGKPKYAPFQANLDETPGVTYEFSAADATYSSPVFMSIKGREPTSDDAQFRTRLIRIWVAAHAPRGATMSHWASAMCGMERKGEFSGCDIFAVKDPASGDQIDYYFYAGNWPFRK